MSTSKNSSLCRVSVVVPVYNAELYLAECIDSIISQTYKDFELILVDDGAKDSSGRICDDYAQHDSRIKVIHQQNGGVTDARRHGVEEAQGEWITFVDADDKLETDGLEKLVRVAIRDSELDIVEGAYTWFYPDGTTKVRKNIALLSDKPVYSDGHDYALSLCQERGAFRGPVAKLIRRSMLMESGAFDIPRWITNREDTMMLTIAAHNVLKHVLVPESVYRYRQQFGDSAIGNKKTLDYWSDYLKYFEEKAIRDKEGDWTDVFHLTVINVFSMIVHGGNIKTGYVPKFFQQEVLPVLKQSVSGLQVVDKLYVRILGLPTIIRYPVCSVLHAIFVVKRSLLGRYFALKSRK